MFFFDRSMLPEANKFSQEIDQAWRTTSGLYSRKDYSIFYSPPVPCSLMFLGINPGGSERTYKIVDVSRGESEYIEAEDKYSQNVGKIFARSLSVSHIEAIRRIQGSNIIWRRSPNIARLKMPKERAAKETLPFLQKYITYVNPRVILFGGKTAYDLFLKTHSLAKLIYSGDTIQGPNGANSTIYFGHRKFTFDYLPHTVDAFIVPHPSKGIRDISINQLKQRLPLLVENTEA